MPGSANTPQPMPFEPAHHWFTGEGIPLTPYDDAGRTNFYPMMELEARDAGGTVVASTRIVLPVSHEMDCSACHLSGSRSSAQPDSGWVWHPDADKDMKLNILKIHDDRELGSPLYEAALAAKGYNPNGLYVTAKIDGTSIQCTQCHWSNALPIPGFGWEGVPTMTEVMHGYHAFVRDPDTRLRLEDATNRESCYRCHPGSKTLCLRGAMGKAVAPDASLAMSCQDCHGSMSAVGASTRNGWFEEPTCQSCHSGTAADNNGQIRYTTVFDAPGHERVAVNSTFAVNPGTLYRFSTGHEGLQCSTCHGSPHAVYPSAHANDNVQNEAIQGHAGTLVECTSCHQSQPLTFTGGPHGMHPVGDGPFARKGDGLPERWFHGKAKEDFGPGLASCQACHGTDYTGTVLSRAHADRVIDVDGMGVKHFWKGYQIGCYSCHNGPNSENSNPDRPAVVSSISASTPANTPLAFTLGATDLDGDSLELRVVDQPHNGRVGLTGSNAVYAPFPNFIGVDTFTFAAWDGEKDSNLGVGTITVTEGPCLLTGITYAPDRAAAHVELPFWASHIVDGCASPLTWQWDFGDGAVASGTPEPTHAYLRTGSYPWRVVVQAGAASVTNQGVIIIGDTTMDTDGDGIEDDWEWAHFGSLTNANEHTDADHDGSSDRHEFLAGTLPKDGQSRLQLSAGINDAAGDLTITWTSAENRSYRLLCSTNLVAGFHTCAASNLVATPPHNTYSNLTAVTQWLQAIAVELE
jgi:hypothetical protein